MRLARTANLTTSVDRRPGRLIAAVVATFALVTLGLGLWHEARHQADTRSAELRAIATAYAAVSAGPVASGDRAGVKLPLRALAQLPGLTYGAVEDAAGRVVAEVGGGTRPSGDAAAPGLSALLPGSTIEVSVPVIEQGQPVGRLWLVGETQGVAEHLLTLLAIVLSGAATAGLVGALAARSLLPDTAPRAIAASRVRIPERGPDRSAPTGAAREAADGLGALPLFPGARALVADDSVVNREVAAEALAQLGIQVDTVEDGRAAASAVLATHYDVVLMDGCMPELDGYAAARLIRRSEASGNRARTCIVALTAHLLGPSAEAWRDAGMDDVLHKPFTLAQLAGCLQRHLALETLASGTPGQELAAPQPLDSDVTLLDPDTLADLAEMAAYSGSDLLTRLLALFREHGPEALCALREAALAGDATAVASAAHKLKSMSLNIGASALAGALAPIENAARETAETPSEQTVAALDDLLGRTLTALDAHSAAVAAAA
jgi:CheY-like chemotaxis protein/HPt (histidine-containing phosphotransfer) domain-containing protein